MEKTSDKYATDSLDKYKDSYLAQTNPAISKAIALCQNDTALFPTLAALDDNKAFYFAFKTTMDAVIAAIAIVVFMPIMLIAALAIKIESRGPAIFIQRRGGIDGTTFDIYKFRTMSEVFENGEVKLVKTKIGKFLRKTSIDELPQLFNVFQGDMSLIGPRPHATYEDDVYKIAVRHYRKRYRMKPGITGFAQVAGLRGAITNNKEIQIRVDFDNIYIENCSIRLDVKILFQTVKVVLKSTNAR